MNSDKFYEMKYYKYKAKIAKLQNGGSAHNFNQRIQDIRERANAKIADIRTERHNYLTQNNGMESNWLEANLELYDKKIQEVYNNMFTKLSEVDREKAIYEDNQSRVRPTIRMSTRKVNDDDDDETEECKIDRSNNLLHNELELQQEEWKNEHINKK